MKRRLAIAAVLALCACGGGPVPGREAKIDASGLSYKSQPDGYDGTDKFTWDPQAQQAYVRWDGTSLTHGSVLVTFLDLNNAKVLEQRVEAGLPPQPAVAKSQQAGAWTIRLDYSGATGVLSFTAVPGH